MRALTAVRVDRDGGVGELVLARPERRNALDYAAVLELLDALRELDADDDVGAVLVYGEGRSFCAGGDLDEFQRGLTAQRLRLPSRRRRLGRADAVDPAHAQARRRRAARARAGRRLRHRRRRRCGDRRRGHRVRHLGDHDRAVPDHRLPDARRRRRGAGGARDGADRTTAVAPRRRCGSASSIASSPPTSTSTSRGRSPASSPPSGRTRSRSASGSCARSTSCPWNGPRRSPRPSRGAFMTTPDFAEGLAAFAEKRPPRFRP